ITSYDIRDRVLSLHGSGLLYYLGYMAQASNFAQSADLATIVAALIDGWQSQSYANFGIDTTHLGTTGLFRTVSYTGSDLKYLSPILSDLRSGETGGFDLYCGPESPRLAMYVPRKGSDLTASVILDGRSIGDPVYMQSIAAGTTASEAYVTGQLSNSPNV